jgi:glycerol kinase
LNVDGGITANRFVMQFLADLLNINVVNIGMEEVSALGAAYLAGLQAGILTNLEQICSLHDKSIKYEPVADSQIMKTAYAGWKEAVRNICQFHD